MESLENLFEGYWTACKMPTKPSWFHKLPANHIEDENKSVKWNREFVEQNNKAYVEAVADANRKRSLEMNRWKLDIVKYIQVNAEVSEAGANAIFDLAYEEGKSSGLYMVQAWIERLIEIVEKCKE